MGKHKGNPYGIRLIATSGHELAAMLRELDAWYGRTPAERTDDTDWQGVALGWQHEAEARGLELDGLKAELTAAKQRAERLVTDRTKLEAAIGNLKREHGTEVERLQALATTWQREARDARQETRTTNARANRLNAALTEAEQQRDEALNKLAKLELDRDKWWRVATKREADRQRVKAGLDVAPDDARSINTRTVEYETRPPIKTDLMGHIELCDYPRWPNPDNSGVAIRCTRPKNHGEVHRRGATAWLVTGGPEA